MPDTYIQAIETPYNGHLFRSRLEARYAVFFDSLSQPYVYEPEAFEMAGTVCHGNYTQPYYARYIPDFYLPDSDCWVEIKPAIPDQETQRKIALFALANDCQVGVCVGDPYDNRVYVFSRDTTVTSHCFTFVHLGGPAHVTVASSMKWSYSVGEPESPSLFWTSSDPNVNIDAELAQSDVDKFKTAQKRARTIRFGLPPRGRYIVRFSAIGNDPKSLALYITRPGERSETRICSSRTITPYGARQFLERLNSNISPGHEVVIVGKEYVDG